MPDVTDDPTPSADYLHFQALLNAGETWQAMSEAERREIILETYPHDQWFDEPLFSALTFFRHDAVQWGRIKAKGKAIGLNVFDFEKAADAKLNGHGTTNSLPFLADWETLTTESRLDALIKSRDIKAWFSEQSLHTLALDTVRKKPAVWGYVKATVNRIGIYPLDLEHAVDGLRTTLQRATETARHETSSRETVDSASFKSRSDASVLADLSQEWRLEIVEVIRHGIENSTLHLRLASHKEIALGSTAEFLNKPAKVRGAIYDATGSVIPYYGPKERKRWEEIAGELFEVSRLVDTPELTRIGQLRTLLVGYCREQKCQLERDASSEDWETLASKDRPFIRGSMLHIHVPTFWLKYTRLHAPDMKQTEVIEVLRLVEATRRTVILNTFKTSRSLWQVPLSILEEITVNNEQITEESQEDRINTGANNANNENNVFL